MHRIRRAEFLLCLVCALTAGCASTIRAPSSGTLARRPSAVGTTAAELEALVVQKRRNVPEFHWIAEWAKKRGIRAWLAGGTATGLATYVKQDALHSLKRADYQYHQIYRTTQDADIVIDAGESTAHELEEALKSRFGHFQGGKSVWEVRLLRGSRGEGAGLKEPLLGNRNFREQHSDSYSTGMIELTDPPPGKSVVRDLFGWDEPGDSRFLTDLALGKIHYYFSPTHGTTARAAAGINPPILSVLRYFTKLSQYSAQPDPADLEIVRRIIADFDPTDAKYKQSYVRKQIENNARKLYLHSRNLERTYNLLNSVGLTGKLIAFDKGEASTNLSEFFARVPLPSKPLGESGATARELFGDGEIVVTHATQDYSVYENITRSIDDSPNVFQSIDGVAGQRAKFGSGFYVKIGREGMAYNGKFQIRFRLDPAAREGVDFTYVREYQYLTIRNKRALRVIDESLRLTPIEYFSLITDPNALNLDAGVRRRLSYEMQSEVARTSAEEMGKLESFIDSRIKSDKEVGWLLEALFDLNLFPHRKQAWLKEVFDKGAIDGNALFQHFIDGKVYAPDLITFALQNGTDLHVTAVFLSVLKRSESLVHPEWMAMLAARNTRVTNTYFEILVRTTAWGKHPELIRACGGRTPDAFDLRMFLEKGGKVGGFTLGRCEETLSMVSNPFDSF